MYNISILMERGKRKMVKGITGQFRLQEIEDLMALTDLLAQIIRNYREAGDEKIADYIRTIRTKDKGEYLEVTAISYDKYESAARNLLPNLNKAENGEIVKRKFRIYKNTIKYDTRYFRRLIFKNVKKERLETLYERP